MTKKTITFAIGILFLGIWTSFAGKLEGKIALPQGLPGIVWIEGAPDAPVPDRNTIITHLEGGRLEPAVSLGFVGNEFVLRNQDDTLHTIHLYLQLAHQKEVSSRPLKNGATLYNIALPNAGMEARRPIRPYHRYREDTGFIEVKCNPHPEEKAYVLVFDHPYAAVAAKDGSFSIAGIPEGKRDVWVWSAGTARKWGTVEIREGEPTVVTIEAGAAP